MTVILMALDVCLLSVSGGINAEPKRSGTKFSTRVRMDSVRPLIIVNEDWDDSLTTLKLASIPLISISLGSSPALSTMVRRNVSLIGII